MAAFPPLVQRWDKQAEGAAGEYLKSHEIRPASLNQQRVRCRANGGRNPAIEHHGDAPEKSLK
jgi:hypothetical protein